MMMSKNRLTRKRKEIRTKLNELYEERDELDEQQRENNAAVTSTLKNQGP